MTDIIREWLKYRLMPVTDESVNNLYKQCTKRYGESVDECLEFNIKNFNEHLHNLGLPTDKEMWECMLQYANEIQMSVESYIEMNAELPTYAYAYRGIDKLASAYVYVNNLFHPRVRNDLPSVSDTDDLKLMCCVIGAYVSTRHMLDRREMYKYISGYRSDNVNITAIESAYVAVCCTTDIEYEQFRRVVWLMYDTEGIDPIRMLTPNECERYLTLMFDGTNIKDIMGCFCKSSVKEALRNVMKNPNAKETLRQYKDDINELMYIAEREYLSSIYHKEFSDVVPIATLARLNQNYNSVNEVDSAFHNFNSLSSDTVHQELLGKISNMTPYDCRDKILKTIKAGGITVKDSFIDELIFQFAVCCNKEVESKLKSVNQCALYIICSYKKNLQKLKELK